MNKLEELKNKYVGMFPDSFIDMAYALGREEAQVDYVAEAERWLNKEYGPQCGAFEPGCVCCVAWKYIMEISHHFANLKPQENVEKPDCDCRIEAKGVNSWILTQCEKHRGQAPMFSSASTEGPYCPEYPLSAKPTLVEKENACRHKEDENGIMIGWAHSKTIKDKHLLLALHENTIKIGKLLERSLNKHISHE